MPKMLPQSSPGFLIFGHRGAAGLAPENTLWSFARAVELGVDGIEMDVRMCGKRAVVIHDVDVDRTTDGSGPVAEHSFSALRNLDAGCGQTIPTLQEALESLPREVMVNIELKGPDTGEPVAEIVHRQLDDDRRSRLVVSSFDYAELAASAAAVPRWRALHSSGAGPLDCWVPRDSCPPGRSTSRIGRRRRNGWRKCVAGVADAWSTPSTTRNAGGSFGPGASTGCSPTIRIASCRSDPCGRPRRRLGFARRDDLEERANGHPFRTSPSSPVRGAVRSCQK